MLAPAERKKRNARLLAALERFSQGDPQEQKETGEYLMKALAESRESNREPGSIREAKSKGRPVKKAVKKVQRSKSPYILTPAELERKNARLRATLERFSRGDAKEQKETGEYLMKALARSRLSNRESR